MRAHIPYWGWIVCMSLAYVYVFPASADGVWGAWALILWGYWSRSWYERWVRSVRADARPVTRREYGVLGVVALLVVLGVWLVVGATPAHAQSYTDVYCAPWDGPTVAQVDKLITGVSYLGVILGTMLGTVIALAFWRFVWVMAVDPILRLARGRAM